MQESKNPPMDSPAARKLNQKLIDENPAIYNLLSPCGKRLYYPREGLLFQAQEAANSRYNATIGIALDDQGKLAHYRSMSKMFALDPCKSLAYASSFGILPLRELWRERLQQKNPRLQGGGCDMSLPVVTSGITHGAWIALQMLLAPGEELLLPHLFWPNYRLIAETHCVARIRTYNTFAGQGPEQGLDLGAIARELSAPGEKKVLLFNFPHNPTGYSPSREEIESLQAILCRAADAGKHIAIICDDAYWGLCYDHNAERESLFSFVAGLHANILAIKLDGATKEDFAWGLRIGFITFGLPSAEEPLSQIFEEKAGAAVRMSTSNCSRLSQEILLSTYQNPETDNERKQLQELLARRYRCIRECLASDEARRESWSRYLCPLPFNSGYFVSFEMQHQKFSAEDFRKYLLAKHDIGLISFGEKYLRFAYSAVAEVNIPHVLRTLHLAYKDLLGN